MISQKIQMTTTSADEGRVDNECQREATEPTNIYLYTERKKEINQAKPSQAKPSQAPYKYKQSVSANWE